MELQANGLKLSDHAIASEHGSVKLLRQLYEYRDGEPKLSYGLPPGLILRTPQTGFILGSDQ